MQGNGVQRASATKVTEIIFFNSIHMNHESVEKNHINIFANKEVKELLPSTFCNQF